MNFKVSDATITSICSPFEKTNDEILTWCDWMRNFDRSVQPNITLKEDGIDINSSQEVAIIGTRKVFNAKAKELLFDMKSSPDFDNILSSVQNYILYIEGSLRPLNVIFEGILSGDTKSGLQKLTSLPGRALVENPKAGYALLTEFIFNTFNGEQNLYNNENDDGLTDDRSEMLKLLNIDVSKTRVNFGNWNAVVTEGIVNHVNVSILKLVSVQRKQYFMDLVKSILVSHDFTHMTFIELQKTLKVLATLSYGFIIKMEKKKLIRVENPGRLPLTKDQISTIHSGVNYAGVHPLISGVIESRVRGNLEKQMQKLKLEKKFIPELTHVVGSTFQTARLKNGHRVGIIAAMSVGENASQAGLRSFHHAGVSDATGFDRIKQVTDNPSIDKVKNGFTIIALNGSPSRVEAYNYVQEIQETRISDVCQVTVGRSSDEVDEISEQFGETPVFVAEPGGWQDRYIKISGKMKSLLEKDPAGERVSTQRPKWLIRLKCNKDRLYEMRMTPVDIAQLIERNIRDARAIASDFTTGLIDVYVNTSGSSQNLGINTDYSKLVMEVAPKLSGILIKGLVGFSKALIQKFEISKFISTIQKVDNSHIVAFNYRDCKLDGVSEDDTYQFLVNKVGSTVKIIKQPEMTFIVEGFVGDLRKRILEPETVKLVDLVLSKDEEDNVLTIKLDKQKALNIHDVDVFEIMSFFQKQNELTTFAPVDIEFNRSDFAVIIRRSHTFTPQDIAKELERFGISEEVSFQGDNIVYSNIRFDADYQRLQIMLRGYGPTLKSKLDRKAKQLTITLYPMSLLGAWSILESIQDCKGITYTTFMSRKRESYNNRYRILAKGIGYDQLSDTEFVNIYATHSSVPIEYYKYFDIEAAFDYINSELVLNAGAEVGNRHLALISDTMCYMGAPIKLKLSGKRATHSGPLATAYFEQTLKLLMDSAAGSRVDNLTSAVGMTLVGDFQRGDYGDEDARKQDTRVESAIDLLMQSTVTTRKVVKTKVEKPKKQTPKPVTESDFFFEDEM